MQLSGNRGTRSQRLAEELELELEAVELGVELEAVELGVELEAVELELELEAVELEAVELELLLGVVKVVVVEAWQTESPPSETSVPMQGTQSTPDSEP